MTTITIKDLIIQSKDTTISKAGSKMYKDTFKNNILSFHYSSGRTMQSICLELSVAESIMSRWKRTHGKDRTAVIHGKGTRNDVRTKALAVQKFINGTDSDVLSKEYGVTLSTIYNWTNQYRSNYEEYLDLPDGVTVIAKPEKHIYGHKNILEVEQLLQDNNQNLTNLINSQHFSTTETNMLKKMKDKTIKTQKEIKDFKNTAEKLNIKL